MQRKTYIENNDIDEALSAYLKRFKTLDAETVAAQDAAGRVTARAVYAQTCDPGYNASAMDGIAVFSGDTESASEGSPLLLEEDRDFVYVNTGNAIPPQFDSVIMIEDVIVDKGKGIKILAPSHPWQHIRVIGESVVASEMVLAGFKTIRPIDVGAILASGNDTVEVIKKPRVGIIPTGGEMVESAAELKVGKLRESNTRVFAALTTEWGGIPKRYDTVEDNQSEIEHALLRAAAENDIVVINAGSSAGTKDYAVRIIEKLGKVFTHGLAIKPGKPTILGEINGKPVIGVPGYPVSAYLVFDLVVRQVIMKLAGAAVQCRQKVLAEITKRAISALKSAEYLRVSIGEVNGRLVATPLERGAAAVMSMVKADGIVVIPKDSEGIEAGEKVEAELLKPLEEIKKAVVIIGSHDMIIDILGDSLPVSSAHVGSLSGIMAMKSGACNIAPIHLLDEQSGEYNIAYVRKYFKPGTMALIKGVGRIQGILTEKGNPRGIKSIEDIRRGKHTFANRQSGAGTRILFDYLLKKYGISAEEIRGYEKEFTTHLAVAVAVKNRAFDCGMAIMTAANIMDLDFVAVGHEEYDFLATREFLEDVRCKRFLEVLKSADFKRKLDAMTGYTYERAGEIILL